MPDRWCPFAIRLDGPPEKTGYSGAQKTHAKVGVTLHSMEYESTPEWDDATTLHNALFSGREASWTFSICKWRGQATLFQHYPIGTTCWAQGYEGNLWLDSIEMEEIAADGTPITEAQLALLVRTLRWIREAHGWFEWIGIGRSIIKLPLVVLGAWLFEHNAVPGAPPTNCAVFTHGQVDPVRLLAALKEEDMAYITDLDALKRRVDIAEEGDDILAAATAWKAAMGTPDEDTRFMALVNKHIAWRLRGKPGWTVPA